MIRDINFSFFFSSYYFGFRGLFCFICRNIAVNSGQLSTSNLNTVNGGNLAKLQESSALNIPALFW